MPYTYNPLSGNFDYYQAGSSTTPSEYSAGNSGTSITVNWANGDTQFVTVTANTTISFSGGTAGGKYTLRLKNNGGFSASFSPTTGAGKVIPQNQAYPVLSTASNAIAFYSIYYDGSYWYIRNTEEPYFQADFANGKSVTLDGVSKYLDGGNNYQYERTQPWSLSFWIKPSVTGVFNLICSNLDSATAYKGCFNVYIDTDNKLYFGLINNNGGQQLYLGTSAVFANTSVWKHVVMTYDGSSTAAGCKIYVNGLVVATTTGSDTLASTVVTTAPFTIGKRKDGQFFAGKLDEFSLWTVVLSASNVTDLYNSGHPGDLSTLSYFVANCASWWRLGDLTDGATTVFDRKSSVNLTSTNMVSGDFTTDVP